MHVAKKRKKNKIMINCNNVLVCIVLSHFKGTTNDTLTFIFAKFADAYSNKIVKKRKCS